MELIETHAHLYSEQFKDDLEQILDAASEAGVKRLYMPNIDHTSIDGMMEIELRFPQTVATMGLHPCYVTKNVERELYIVEEWLQKRSFAAIGEAGIDLYWDKTFFAQQQEALRVQLDWAKRYQLPIILHCRDSFEETIQLVEEYADKSLTGVFHCFTGNLQDAERVIKAGFMLGIGGVATFKNGGMDKVLPHIGLEHLVLETDSPYLAPAPHRGKRNEPAYLSLVLRKLAELKQTSPEEVAQISTQNANRLFKFAE
jgi:TatD DNase family protein